MTARALAAAFAVLAWLLPRLAEACPACAGRGPGGPSRIIALGIMILLPFAIAVIVFRLIRRANAQAKAFERPM